MELLKSLKILLFLLLALPVLGQEVGDDKQIVIEGFIYNLEDSTALVDVHVMNRSNNRALVSDMTGQYQMQIEHGDILLFTSIGYEDLYIDTRVLKVKLNQKIEANLYLRSMAYQLDEIDIFSFSKESFRQDFLSQPITEVEKEFDLNLPFPTKFERQYEPYSVKGAAASLSPISLIYNLVSPKARRYRQYSKLKDTHEIRAVASAIYNRDLVKKVLEIKNEEEVDAFLVFCQLPDEYVIEASEYQLYESLQACYEEFLVTD